MVHLEDILIHAFCNQGDFDIIGGAPALTEAETIKVPFVLLQFHILFLFKENGFY